MRLTKKLLTALLPITAAGVLAPVLSSCNKGDGYVINYLDEVNCLDEKASNYHTLTRVKEVVKGRTDIESSPTVNYYDLPTWSTEADKQSLYFDLIASLSIVGEYKFHLTYDASKDLHFKLEYTDKDGKSGAIESADISYDANESYGKQVNVVIGTDTLSLSIKSYRFQNTEITYE